jgi:hypothetical protein
MLMEVGLPLTPDYTQYDVVLLVIHNMNFITHFSSYFLCIYHFPHSAVFYLMLFWLFNIRYILTLNVIFTLQLTFIY